MNRSLTPREAARVQSFPDWFRFPASRTLAYRLIGAVPPLVAEAVGLAVNEFLGRLHVLDHASGNHEPRSGDFLVAAGCAVGRQECRPSEGRFMESAGDPPDETAGRASAQQRTTKLVIPDIPSGGSPDGTGQ